MKVEVDKMGELVLKEVYLGLTLETAEGNQMIVCMRDDTFEFCFVPKGEDTVLNWKSFNMQTQEIE